MNRTIRLAVRDWDYVTPLILGEVDLAPLHRLGADLEVHRVQTLPDLGRRAGRDRTELARPEHADRPAPEAPTFDAAELSLSRYCTAVGRGDRSLVARPHFLMQTFRHRCVIVREDSPITRFEQLVGGRLGLTGWQDSGNTWTRALLADHGVGIEDARWVAGRLTEGHPETDRLQGYGRPGRIEQAPASQTLMGLLAEGELDAVMTPFMPPEFFDHPSPWRPLLPDVAAAESAYAQGKGFVPGIHLLGFTAELANSHPRLTDVVSDLLWESRRTWLQRRRKYADTSTWLLLDLRREARQLPPGWDGRGLDQQAAMVEEFLAEQRRQGLSDRTPALADLFPLDVSRQGTPEEMTTTTTQESA